MPLVVADRVQETTNTTGTGTLTLAGAVSGFRTFSAAIGNANTTYYAIVSGTDWEVGLGTYTSAGNTLSRDTVLESSAGGTTKITVASGATVFATYPADKAVYLDSNNNIGLGLANDGSAFLQIAAGTTTKAPIELTSGTLMTTADGGSVEYDGTAFYSSIANSTRGVMPSEQWIVLTGTNTLTSQTAAQALFDGGGGSASGAVTLPVGTYQFECFYSLSSMSSTSGSFGFALGGTATKTQAWTAIAAKANPVTTASNASITYNTSASNTTLVTANLITVGHATIKGIIRVTVTGTIIPQVSLGVAAAAVVGTNSYFKISPIGNDTVATVGNWS